MRATLLRRVVRRAGVAALAAILVMTVSPSALARGKADLVVTAISDPPSTRVVGEGFTENVTIKNRSRKRRAPASTLTLYLSSDATKDAGDPAIGTTTVAPIRPRKSVSGPVHADIPGGTANGPYFVIACADSGNTVREKNETNNCTPSAVTTTVGTCVAGLNDTFATATTLTAGSAATNGGLCPGSADFYKMTLGTNQSVTVTVTPSPEPDIVLTSYDAGQNQLNQVDNNFRGQQEMITISAGAAGIYYVQVSQFDPDTAGSYTIAAQ